MLEITQTPALQYRASGGKVDYKAIIDIQALARQFIERREMAENEGGYCHVAPVYPRLPVSERHRDRLAVLDAAQVQREADPDYYLVNFGWPMLPALGEGE